MKRKKLKNKPVPVAVVNDVVNVSVKDRPFLITLFESREIAANGEALGPLGGLDLTGYSEYRLTLHFAGAPGAPFEIRELFGPAGEVDQVSFAVDSGHIGPQGVLNYRARFDVFSPRNLFIQVSNRGTAPMQVNGTLYAVR